MLSPEAKDKLKERMRRPLLVALIVLAALPSAIIDVPEYLDELRSQSWPSVPATIVASKVPATFSVELRDTYSEPCTKYEYIVDQKVHSGTRVRFQRDRALIGYDLGVFLDKNKVGAPVTVRVEPGNPDNAVLIAEPDVFRILGHMIAAMFFFGLFYLSLYPTFSTKDAGSVPAA